MDKARLDAASTGRVRYISIECPRCGGVERYTTSANCVVCASKAAKKRYAKMSAILKAAKAEAIEKMDAALLLAEGRD